MDRVTRFNVIALSGKAVEACGDVDTMILMIKQVLLHSEIDWRVILLMLTV